MTRPLCKCHGEPMAKDGHAKDGRQKWACARRRAASAARYFAANRERVLERQRDRYDANALPTLMRVLLYDHRKRLEQLQTAVTEGGR